MVKSMKLLFFSLLLIY